MVGFYHLFYNIGHAVMQLQKYKNPFSPQRRVLVHERSVPVSGALAVTSHPLQGMFIIELANTRTRLCDVSETAP